MNRQFGVIKLGNGESPADLAAAGHLARTHRELCLRYISLRPNTFRCAASAVIHIIFFFFFKSIYIPGYKPTD